MNAIQLKQMIADKQLKMLESAWMEAVEENIPAAEFAAPLEALVKSDNLDLAETLAMFLLDDRMKKRTPAEALEAAKAAVSAIPLSDELRTRASGLYRTVYSQVAPKWLDTVMEASGLLSGQSPRRCLRTLDTCLAMQVGSFLANRYDHRVVKLGKFNELFGEFELLDADGRMTRQEPKILADEFELVDESDFRVLVTHRPDELRKLLLSSPATVLIGICMANGGSIDSNSLRDRLVPRYIASGDWSTWWSKARTAAKRSPNLSIEGRSPVTISYHSGGRSLEEEMAEAVTAAKTPLEKLAVLSSYVRDARDRKLTVNNDFVNPIIAALAQEAVTFQARRPGDALAASLAIGAVGRLNLPVSTVAYPSPEEILAQADHPAGAVAHLGEASLWPPALDALIKRPDAAHQLALLLKHTPTNLLDEVAKRMVALNAAGDIEKATAAAYGDPLAHLEFYLWLWKGPAVVPANIPSKIELLSRLLKAMHDLEHDWDAKPAHRKAVFGRIRSALSASDFAAYRAAVAQMSEPVAETIKRQIERGSIVLAESASEGMLAILKESYYNLFVTREKLDLWADPGIIWTGEEAYRRREKELKELVDVKMLENARAIGAAAAHGDLSENSEWKFALEERDMLRARVGKMQDELSIARVIHPQEISVDRVNVGTKVTLRRQSDNGVLELTFLGPWESDLEKRVYSYQTPIAQELMGKELGAAVHLKIDLEEGDYIIEKIVPGL